MHSSNHTNTTENDCIIWHAQNKTALQVSVFLTGIRRLTVTRKGRSPLPSANHSQYQLWNPLFFFTLYNESTKAQLKNYYTAPTCFDIFRGLVVSTLLSYISMSVQWLVESSWNVMAHGDAREGKWRGNWRMEWVASTLHTTSQHCVSSITTADAHTSVASSRLNWRPRWFKWTRPFRRKTKSGFCACAITFQLASNII